MTKRDEIIRGVQVVLRDYKIFGGLELAGEVRLMADILYEYEKALDKQQDGSYTQSGRTMTDRRRK